MEILVSLSSILKDIVKDVDDSATKQDFVMEHIKNVTKNDLIGLQLPQGKDWFNVSRPLTEKDLQGKVVVLDFFTYCCINCLHLIPHLKALEENFSISDGLVVIGVHSAKFENEKKSSNIDLALKRYSITHPVINDTNCFMWDRMNIACWPTVVILGPTGQALFVLIGEQCRDELFLYVETTLKYYKNKISSHLLPLSYENIVTSSVLSFPGKIARFQNVLAISDSGNHRILVMDETGSVLHRIGGKTSGFKDGPLHEAKFNCPQGVAFYNRNQIYVADTENHVIRLVDLEKNEVKTVAGTGIQGTDFVGGKNGTSQELSSPWDLCFVSPVHVKERPSAIGMPPMDNMEKPGSFPNIPPPPFTIPPPPPPSMSPMTSINQSSDNVIEKRSDQNLDEENVLLIAMSGIHQIWALFLKDTIWWKGKKYDRGVCAAIAGSGKEENRNNRYPMMASFAQPSGIAYSNKQKAVFIADSESSSIRKLSLVDGSVTHVVGGDKNPVDLFNFGDVDGKGHGAKLQHPLGVACSKESNMLYICDTYNNKIKKINTDTLECSSLHTDKNLFNEPSDCILADGEDILFVADTNNNSIVTYDLKKNVGRNLAVKEPEDDTPKMKEDTWEVDVEMSAEAGSLTLALNIGPQDVHGNWKLDLANCGNVEADQLKGEISSTPQELKFKVLPTKSDRSIDVVYVLFNLSFCEKDICRFKRQKLKLSIKRKKQGEKSVKLEFHKVIN